MVTEIMFFLGAEQRTIKPIKVIPERINPQYRPTNRGEYRLNAE